MAISLISLHLFGNTELGQVFSLPQLLRHYHFHQLHDSSLSFFSFLVEHYSGDDGTTSDDNEDMKLPLHNVTHVILSISNLAPVSIETGIEHPDFPLISFFRSFRPENIPQRKTEVIIQPPRPVC